MTTLCRFNLKSEISARRLMSCESRSHFLRPARRAEKNIDVIVRWRPFGAAPARLFFASEMLSDLITMKVSHRPADSVRCCVLRYLISPLNLELNEKDT